MESCENGKLRKFGIKFMRFCENGKYLQKIDNKILHVGLQLNNLNIIIIYEK